MTENNQNHGPDPGEIDASLTEADSSFRQVVAEQVSNRDFTAWYEERQIEQNILEGKSYFNGPSPPKDPEYHTPSKLLQCHRKVRYDRQNAPREDTPPDGLFWIGTEFEEGIIVPYLQDTVPGELYVQNSLWIDTTITIGEDELRLRGSTDPAIVTSDADPVFLTEIKTTTSLDHLTEPKPHHRAQLHTYLYGLNEKHDYPVTDGMIIYGCRKTLDIEVFHVTFDRDFWENKVTEWMLSQTQYERSQDLPPAVPEFEWECTYCSYKHRCGQADSPYSDIDPEGLLPLFTEYDRQNLIEYLEAHAEHGAKLTPTLAYVFPEIAQQYGVYDWHCQGCGESYSWESVDWDGDVSSPPVCQECISTGDFITLSGPSPATQLSNDQDHTTGAE